jgi:predicted CopG family antitoxin
MIGVYWFIRSLISLGKQYLIKLAMPIPQYTEEEIKEMEKMERERQKAQKAALKAQPKYRSLHYIDEEDYEELPEVKSQNPTKNVSGDRPEIKD